MSWFIAAVGMWASAWTGIAISQLVHDSKHHGDLLALGASTWMFVIVVALATLVEKTR